MNIDALMPIIIDYGTRILGVFVVMWIAFRLASRLENLIRAGLGKRNFDPSLTGFLASLARWGLIVGAVLTCLEVFNVNTTSFAAVIGAASLAIGLAFQGTLSNFAAGVLLLTFRPFKVGDYVGVADQEGVVAEIGLFVTALDTIANHRVILSNTAVSTSTIINYTHHSHRRVHIDVGVSYGANLDKARRVLDEAATSVPLRDPDKGHQIILLKLNESSVDFQVRVWCKAEDYWTAWDQTTLAVKKALDENDVSIPFPQMDLHIKEAPAPDMPRSAA